MQRTRPAIRLSRAVSQAWDGGSAFTFKMAAQQPRATHQKNFLQRAAFEGRVARMLVSTTDQEDDGLPVKRPGGITGKGFVPGRSGNPSGLSRDANAASARLRRIAAAMTEVGLQEALEIAQDKREKTNDRLRAIELIVRCGHADAAPAERDAEPRQVVVRPFVIEARPTPGVINSPIKGHIALPSGASPSRNPMELNAPIEPSFD